MATISYFIITAQGAPESLLTPPMVATLLVANLVPAMALMVLVARRMAMRRAAHSPIGGRGRLHVRLVALFSVIASVPTLLVVIFASLLFQSGVQFWFSDRARTVLENAEKVAAGLCATSIKERIQRDVEAMGGDVVDAINAVRHRQPGVRRRLLSTRSATRDLTEAAILSVDAERRDPDASPASISTTGRSSSAFPPRRCCERCAAARRASSPTPATGSRRSSGSIRRREVYLYGARAVNPTALAADRRGAERRQRLSADARRARARCSSGSTPSCCWSRC